MKTTLELESTITDRYQTTVPTPIRQALKLKKRDKIRYTVQADGSVWLTRAEPAEQEDPVLAGFLDFLSRDMTAHPEQIRGMGPEWAARIQSLVAGVKVDLQAPLATGDE